MKVNVVKNMFVLVLAVLFSAVAMASSVDSPSNKIGKNSNVDIRYTGSNQDFFNFEVAVRQTGNQRLTLRILDEAGIELYRESIGKGGFSKAVKVVRNDYSRLNFVVDSQNGQYRKSFKIQSEVLERINVVEEETSNNN
jgi:opacity protein-like surface antigen